MNMSKREIQRADRAITRAIDAVDLLRDLGFGCDATERAMEQLRRVQFTVNDAVIKYDA